MTLKYEFEELDQKLSILESAQATQRSDLSKNGHITPGLAQDLDAAAQRVVATRPEWDLSGSIGKVLARLLPREAAERWALKRRLARLSAMRWSLRLAITWEPLKVWLKEARNDWRR